MKASSIKRSVALLVAVILTLSYTIFPDNAFKAAYASSSGPASILDSSVPTVTKQPQDLTVKPGVTARFSVSAKGTGTLKYQWYYKKSGSSDWTIWKGRASASIDPVSNASWNMMNVRCRVSDDNGSVYSDAATVKIDQPLVILSQPGDVTAKVGDEVPFSVQAQGKGALKYQWYYKKSGSSWNIWKGRTTARIVPVANATWDQMQVRCLVTDDSGSVYSDAAIVDIQVPLKILKHPENVTAKPDENVKFSVSAQGKGSLTYQWYYKKVNADDWTIWKGRTTASISPTSNPTWNMMQVRCKVTDTTGSIYSDAATITIDQPLVVLTQPKNVTVKAGDKADLSVSAQGTGALKYQWYYKMADSDSWKTWNGAVTPSISLTSNSSWNMMQARCMVTDDKSSIYSDAATITIDQPLVILTQPSNVTVKVGNKVNLSVSAQGKGALTYQWYYKKAASSSWSKWSGAITPSISLTSNSTWNMMQARCLVTDDAGSIYSDPAVITISQPLKINSVSQPDYIFPDSGETVTIQVNAQGTGALSYQWYYKSSTASTWTPWNGKKATSVSFTADSSWNNKTIICKIYDATGSSIKTDPITVITSSKIVITKQPADTTVPTGQTVKFSISAYGQNSLTYQWYYKKAGNSQWSLWSGQTKSTISSATNYTWNGMQIYCKISDSKNHSVISKAITVTLTKQSDKRYFSRTITVKKSGTKIYSGAGTDTQVVGTVSANSSFTVLEWDSDSGDTTWYSFKYNGKTVWIPRTSVTSTLEYTTIPDRKFNNGGLPVIYLSPSRQSANLYAVGNTTEQAQMYNVANQLKTILENEYYCSVYIPPTSMKLGLKNRAYDAYTRNADVYLAIHSNSVPGGAKMHGATGFYFPASNQSYQLAQNIVDEMGKIEFQKSIVKNKLVNGMTAYENTGYGEVRDPSYYGMISVLAEVEYHHYEAPARWIINNNDKIARALANSLANTLGMKKKS